MKLSNIEMKDSICDNETLLIWIACKLFLMTSDAGPLGHIIFINLSYVFFLECFEMESTVCLDIIIKADLSFDNGQHYKG